MTVNFKNKLLEEDYLTRRYTLNPYVKLSIILVLIFTLKTNFWVSEFLHNIGFPYLRFQKIIFLIAPGLYILNVARKNHRLRFKNLIVFLVFFIFHYIMEKYAYGNSNNLDSSIELLDKWLYIYVIYLSLTNIDLKYSKYVLNVVIKLLLINVTLVYLDLFNFINIAEIAVGSNNMEGRLNSNFNLNSVCDMNVLGVYCIYWLDYLGHPFKLFNKKFPKFIYVIYFAVLIFLQSSRGSLILFLVGVILYSYLKWKYLSGSKKTLIIIGIILFSSLQINVFENYLSEISVFNRLTDTSLKLDDAEENYDGRYLQIISSTQNFLSSPIIGVGYPRAASNYYEGITRSNFQYTQILAAGGVLFFIIYFFMVFKFFAHSIYLIKKDLIVKSILIFVLVAFIFRRPEPYFAIMAFIVSRRIQIRN